MGAKKEQLLHPDERLWKKEQAMEFLGVGRSALYVMISRNEIPFLRVNNSLRFIPEQLKAWAKKKTAQHS
jgi:excisionase family DNA binding protein